VTPFGLNGVSPGVRATLRLESDRSVQLAEKWPLVQGVFDVPEVRSGDYGPVS
jgi:hypothetical protein